MQFPADCSSLESLYSIHATPLKRLPCRRLSEPIIPGFQPQLLWRSAASKLPCRPQTKSPDTKTASQFPARRSHYLHLLSSSLSLCASRLPSVPECAQSQQPGHQRQQLARLGSRNNPCWRHCRQNHLIPAEIVVDVPIPSVLLESCRRGIHKRATL